MTTVDDIVKELADIQRRLLDLPDGDRAEQFKLLSRRDELRRQASALGGTWDADRPTEDIEAELASQRERLEALVDSHSGYVTSRGGNSQGPDGGEKAKLTWRAKQAAGIDPILARIAYLESLLAKRRG